MPTYEFRCPNGHEFERFYRKISEAASELPCPECGAVASRQLSAGAGLLFKGSGFYLTDYGKNAHRKPGPAAAGSKPSDSKTEGTGSASDAKPTETKSSAPTTSGNKSSGKSGGSGGGGDTD